MFFVNTILHPTDFSERSKDAFELACGLASQYGAKLILVHVIPEPPPPTLPYAEAGLGATRGEEEVEDQLEEMCAAHPSIRTECFVARGTPAAEILRVARETNPDFIIMGTHGRTGLRRLLLGSVAESIVRSAPCRVITVKEKMPAEEAVLAGAEQIPANQG